MRYYKRFDIDGKTTAVESYSHDLPVAVAYKDDLPVLDSVEITEKEYNDYIKSLPVPEVVQQRDIYKELDALKIEIEALKGR